MRVNADKRLTHLEIFEAAKKKTKRQENGSLDIPDLIQNVKNFVRSQFDLDAEVAALAKKIIDERCKTGLCDPSGQLRFADFADYGYEPNRMIKNDELSQIIEQEASPVDFKFADASRSTKHAVKAQESAARKQHEAQEMAKWVLKEQKTGRPQNQLTFGNFIREAGIWDETAPPEDDGSNDDES